MVSASSDPIQTRELSAFKFTVGVGQTPVTTQSAYTQTYSTASKTHPTPTFAAGSIDTGTDMTAAEAAQLVADILALNKLIVALIDDMQAFGMVA